MNSSSNRDPILDSLIFSPVSPTHRQRVSGDQISLYDDEAYPEGLTYASLRALIEARTSLFDSDRKELVFCCIPRSVDGVVCFYAATQSGHAIALIDPTLSAFSDLVRAYQPAWIVTPERGALDGYVCVEHHDSASTALRVYQRITRTDVIIHPDLYLLLLTSGSTGSSKAARLSYRNINENVRAIIDSLSLGPCERAIGHLPLSYSFGLSIVTMQMAAGGAVVLSEQGLMTAGFWKTMREKCATLFPGVPYHYDILAKLDIDRLDMPDLRVFLQAGGKMSQEACRDFYNKIRRRQGRFYVMYGQTEASPRMSCFLVNDFPDKIGSSGRVLRGGSVDIIDGEIVYQGPNVMMGYASDLSDLEQGDGMNGVLRTGDLGHMDADGFLTITGRIKRIAKLCGQRVSLDDLEQEAQKILESQGAASCPFVAIDKDNQVVFFTLNEHCHKLTLVRDAISKKMHLHHSSFEMKVIPSMPHKENGKIDYDALRSME